MPKDNVVAASVHVLAGERDGNEETGMQKAGSSLWEAASAVMRLSRHVEQHHG